MEPIVAGVGGGIAAVLGIAAFVNAKGSRTGDPDMRMPTRQRGEPFSWTYTTTSGRVVDALVDLGLDPAGDDGEVKRFEGGSQIKTRLLGGYFVGPRDLPVTVLLTEATEPDGSNRIEVRDRLGPIALRDRALGARYAIRAAEIRQDLDSR